jgi:hypothetical protein
VNIDGMLYVTYSGPSGIVNVFDTNGYLLKRFATGGNLLNPWGVAVAPADFGKFSNALLVGNFNFGDPTTGAGYISAFDAVTGSSLGLLKNTDGNPLTIDGLWALLAGNGQSGGESDKVYFSAGIQKQLHGLMGSLAACRGPEISDVAASPNVLWPPNHKMVPVAVGYTVADDCVPAPVCDLSVSSNEGEGGGSGHTSPDWDVMGPHVVDLRAERAGKGGDRIYTITIDCTDKLGLSSRSNTVVTVPHDQGKKR